MTFTVAMPGIIIWMSQGEAGRFAPDIELAAAEVNNFNPRREECHPARGSISPSCVHNHADIKVVVVGDSHANALVTGLAQAAAITKSGVLEWTYSGCQFVSGMRKTPDLLASMVGNHEYQCDKFIEWTESHLGELPKTIPVVIIGRYSGAAFGENDSQQKAEVPNVYFSKIYEHTTNEFLAEFSGHITQSACQIAKHRQVYLVRPVPEMGFHVPKTLSRHMILGMNDDLSIPVEFYLKRNAWVWAAQDAARDQCGIRILDPTKYLCRNGRCYGSKEGRPLYIDSNHLSEFGNKLLVPMFVEVFK